MLPYPLCIIYADVWDVICQYLTVRDLFNLEKAIPELISRRSSARWKRILNRQEFFYVTQPGMGVLDFKREAIHQKYVADFFDQSTGESYRFRAPCMGQRSISDIHIPQNSNNLLIAASMLGNAHVYTVDADQAQVCHLQKLSYREAPYIFQFDSHDDCLAVSDGTLLIYKKTNSSYCMHVDLKDQKSMRNPCFRDNHTVLVTSDWSSIHAIDFRNPDRCSLSLKVDTDADIQKLLLPTLPKYEGLCEQMRRNTVLKQNSPVVNDPLVDDSVCKTREAYSISNNHVIVSTDNIIQLWDLRASKEVAARKTFKDPIVLSLIDGSEVLVNESPDKLHLFDTRPALWETMYSELFPVPGSRIRQLEVTVNYVLALDKNGTVYTTHTTWPLVFIRSLETVGGACVLSAPARDHMLAMGFMDYTVEVLTRRKSSHMYDYLFGN